MCFLLLSTDVAKVVFLRIDVKIAELYCALGGPGCCGQGYTLGPYYCQFLFML